MFKKLTIKEQLKNERVEKHKLLEKQQILENALLELAQIASTIVTQEEENNG